MVFCIIEYRTFYCHTKNVITPIQLKNLENMLLLNFRVCDAGTRMFEIEFKNDTNIY